LIKLYNGDNEEQLVITEYLLSRNVICETDLGSELAGAEFSLPGDALYVDPASYTCWSGFETAGTAW